MPERGATLTAVGMGLVVTGSLLFVASAGVAAWAAYDPAAGWMRFALLSGGALLYLPAGFVLRVDRRRTLAGLAALACAVLAAVLAVYFALDHDWTQQPADFGAVQTVALQVQALRPTVTLPEDVNPNMAGSALALLIPLGVGGLFWLPARLRWRGAALPMVVTLLCVLAALAGLALTTSRGAWLGLAAGPVVALYAGWRSGAARPKGLRFVADVGLWLLLLGIAGGMLLVLARPDVAAQLLGTQGGARGQLWIDGLALATDYRFTGSGLGATMMVYSTYYFLLHVGFVGHMHNLLLQVTVEQGLPGLIGLVAMLSGSALLLVDVLHGGRAGQRRLALAGLASLTTLLVQGLVDTGVYAALVCPLLFVPTTLAWGLRRKPVGVGSAAWLGVALPLAALLVVLVWPGSRAALQANLGAVAQSRAELSVYEWPAWGIQDALRRAPEAVDLREAEARYAAALALDPGQVTALARVGQLALSRGDYDGARPYLEAAYAAAPERAALRQLLGEVYAVSGETDVAVALWRTVPNANGQLAARRWWVGETGTAEQVAGFERAAPR